LAAAIIERPMIEIRYEAPDDVPAIRCVHEQAFSGPAEAALVDRLREHGKVAVSLVAEEDGEVIGHVLFTPVTIDPSHPSFHGAGMAPLAVLPPYQHRGIGSHLVHAGLDACRRRGFKLAVVLGDPDYYPRFGFSRALVHGLENEYHADRAFMAMALENGALEPLCGTIRYQPEFNEI
jgi:putative acetyltransferase